MVGFKARTLHELADAVIEDVEDADWGIDEPIAAAIVELVYNSCFIVPHVTMQAHEAELRTQPVPVAVRDLLGERISAHLANRHRESWPELLPLAVLHRCAIEYARSLHGILYQAFELALNRNLRWWENDGPPMIWTSTGGESSLKTPRRALQAKDEFHAARRSIREVNDPVINGRPKELLEPAPKHKNDFLYWCLKLSSVLGSPRAMEHNYIEVIRELGERCLMSMPDAKAQARARKLEDPIQFHDDRFGSEHNETLPKYARWLIKAGEYATAKRVCELALRYKIEPSSTGAFDRTLQSATQKLVGVARKGEKAAKQKAVVSRVQMHVRKSE